MGLFDFLKELRQPQKEATPTFENVVQGAMDAKLTETHVSMPGKVIKYDHKKMMADVQPMMKRKYKDGTVVDPPVIYNVPVAHPRAGKAFVHMPIAKDDKVMLVFQDKSMEKWITSGEIQDPEDVRKHHMSDAVAYPGLYSQHANDQVQVTNSNDLIMRNEATDGSGSLEIRVKKNNHIQFVNGDNLDLTKVLADIFRHIREARTITGVGLQPLQHPKFAQDEARLRSFLET